LWAKVVKLNDGILLMCQYAYFDENENGEIGLSGVGFYQSKDDSVSWAQISSIPFYVDNLYDGDNSVKRTFLGYTGPIFQVLKNNKVLCILRSFPTYKEALMYMAVSND
jgi:hypothetical protein